MEVVFALAALVIILGLIWLLLYLYFLPTIIAHHYDNENTKRIFLVNLVTGLTCLGWLVAFFWAILEKDDIDLIETIREKL